MVHNYIPEKRNFPANIMFSSETQPLPPPPHPPPHPPPNSNFVVNAITFEGFNLLSSIKNKKLKIDLKWPEMPSKVIFGHPKWPPAPIVGVGVNFKGGRANLRNSSVTLAPLCHLATELFKCRLVRCRRRRQL